MLIRVPDSLVAEAIEAITIQKSGSVKSTEGRSRQVERIEHHVAELFIAVIEKELKDRKLLTHKPNE